MTTVWVISGIFLIALGTFIMWYFPHRESLKKELEIRETGKFSKIISFDMPTIGNGESSFKIAGGNPIPIISNSAGNGILKIPMNDSIAKGVLYAWIQNNEMKMSITIYNSNLEVISYISGNEWVVNKSTEIDCNYDLESFEVVSLKNDILRPVLQVQLKQDKVDLAFETYLNEDICLFWGNSKIEFTGENHRVIKNDLKPLFQYPSSKFFGKRN